MASNRLSRRAFCGAGLVSVARAAQAPRPNILWITCEDTGPHLGAYGDRYADTPNLDRLAARGMIYRHVWSTAPVCAPARTAIISGMYPSSTGSEHMRTLTRLPSGMRMYPCYLREAGYYCTNNSKEDYNLEHTGQVWDESSPKAHWRNRKPGQPFFAIFNLTVTHESQIRRRPHTLQHDPQRVRVPAYHPDTPEVRHDWAQYYDNITVMDQQAGTLLRELETAGLAEDTIVFFYGDHGSGMPRSKRWPYDSGLHVPLIVSFPEKWRHLAPKEYRPGGASDRLVSFVDLAPTVLSLAGIKPPSHMQGAAFLGPFTAPPPAYLHGLRGRMDERYDMVRTVRNHRYVYVRNYMPHRIYGQHVSYMFETPTTRVWKELYEQGKLNAAQRRFWETKPPEELYDLETDPDEVNNLADSAAHRQILERMRQAQREHALRIRDVGFLPEDEIYRRSQGSSPYQMGHDPRLYPMERVMEMAEVASSLDPAAVPRLLKAFSDADSGVRYWAVTGLLMRGERAVAAGRVELRKALEDPSPSVRIPAAEALGRYGEAEDLKRALDVLLELSNAEKHGNWVAIAALNALDYLNDRARPVREAIARLPKEDPRAPKRAREYIARLLEKILADLS